MFCSPNPPPHLSPFLAAVTALLLGGMVSFSSQAAEPDLSTPKGAATAFAQALESGNADGAKAAAVDEPQNTELIGVLTEMGQNVKKLRQASTAKFGKDAANKFVGAEQSPEALAKQLDSAEIQVEGDTATIRNPTPPAGESPGNRSPQATGGLTLKKVNGQWKVDLTANAQGAQMVQQLPFLRAVSTSFGEVAGEVSADKYKTIDEAKQAMQAKLMAATLQMRRPSTAPSSPGANPATGPAAEAAPPTTGPVGR